MTPLQASAHVVVHGPYKGQAIGHIAGTSAGIEWLNRLRILIPIESNNSYGQLAKCINVYFADPVNSRRLEASS